MIDQTAQRTMQVPGQGLIPAGRPTVDFKEYPKMMTHPQFQPGKPSEPIKHPSGFTYHGIGTPIRFAPVLVKSKQDEEYHASLGYGNAVQCDPAAFDRAVGAGQIPDQVAYKPLEYPKWVNGKLVHSKEEETKFLGQEIRETPYLGGAEPKEDRVMAQATPAVSDAMVKAGADALYEGEFSPRSSFFDPEEAAKAVHQAMVTAETKEERIGRLRRELAELEGLSFSPEELKDTLVEYKERFLDPLAKELRKKAAPKKIAKKPRKAVVLTDQQKRDRSQAIRDGLARKRALAESETSNQSDDAPAS